MFVLDRNCEATEITFYGEKYERCIGYHINTKTNRVEKDSDTTLPETLGTDAFGTNTVAGTDSPAADIAIKMCSMSLMRRKKPKTLLDKKIGKIQ